MQAELSDAIRINAAVQDESSNAAPPAAVTTALFEKAGIGAGAGGMLSPTAGATGAGALATLFPFMKRSILPITTGILGALLAILLMPEPGLNGNLQEAGTGRERTLAATDIEGRGDVSDSPALTTELTESNPPHQVQGPTRRFRTMGRESLARQDKDILLPPSTATANDDNAQESLSTTQVIEAASVPERYTQELYELSPHPVEIRERASALRSEVASSRPDFSRPSASATPLRFSAQLRGILGLGTFPNRSIENEQNMTFDNLALTAFWHPSEHHAIGVEVGRERHPLYVQDQGGGLILLEINGAESNQPDIDITGILNDDVNTTKNGNSRGASIVDQQEPAVPSDSVNGYHLEPIVEWMGVAYQYKGGTFDSRQTLAPYVQTMIGGTATGPIGKGTVGLSWKPEDRISLGLGLEGTALFYRRDGEWYTSRKLGATYSLQVEF